MPRLTPCNEECYQQVAQELNLPLAIVKEIINIQSLAGVRVIQTGGFESLMLPYLGKLRAKPAHVQQINERAGISRIHKPVSRKTILKQTA
jgi:hypothetical protein